MTIHKDTRSGGDTDDTVIRVVVVTVVDSSDISGESVRDLRVNNLGSTRERVGIRETCRRSTLPVVLRRTYTEDVLREVDRTAQRQSDTRWQHVRCVKTYEPTRATRSRNALSPINREHMCSATCSAIPGWSSRRDAGEPHPSALISRHKRRQVQMRYRLFLCRHVLTRRNHTLSLTIRHTRILSSMTL